MKEKLEAMLDALVQENMEECESLFHSYVTTKLSQLIENDNMDDEENENSESSENMDDEEDENEESPESSEDENDDEEESDETSDDLGDDDSETSDMDDEEDEKEYK